MGIPRKGSRRVEVDGKPYRYLVRQDGALVDHDAEDPSMSYMKPQREFLLVTVQEETEEPGNVLQWRSPNSVTVAAEDVKTGIQTALQRGWNPSKRGGVFRLGA